MGQQAVRSIAATSKAAWCTVARRTGVARSLICLLCLQYGILAGGLADGSICLWNPAAIVDGSGHNPLLSKMQKHSGAVSGLPCQRQCSCKPTAPLLLLLGHEKQRSNMYSNLCPGEGPGVQRLQHEPLGFRRSRWRAVHLGRCSAHTALAVPSAQGVYCAAAWRQLHTPLRCN